MHQLDELTTPVADRKARAPLGFSRTRLLLDSQYRQTRSGPAPPEPMEVSSCSAPPSLPPPPPPPRQRLTLRGILTALGVPLTDEAGRKLPASLLDRRFDMGLSNMSATSGGRRNLMQAGSVAVYHVLDALAPDPLATAAALSAVPKRSWPDSSAGAGLRSALATSTPPRGRRLLDLIAQSPMAKSLVYSYICAEQRKEPVRVLAQILSPLTAGYSLRIFNECFEFQLGEAGLGPLTRYRWRYAKWHACIWLSGQTPAVSKTEKWRLKGGGDLGTLPHSKLVGAVDFLASGDNMQHVAFGTHRVKTSTGWVEFPKTQRRQCAEALHTAYAATRDATLRPAVAISWSWQKWWRGRRKSHTAR